MPVSLDFTRRLYPTARDRGAAERAQRATTLDGQVGGGFKSRLKADTARVLALLSGLVREIEGADVRDLANATNVPLNIVGLEPGSPNAEAFDAFLAQFIDQIADDGKTVEAPSATRTRLTAGALGITRRTAQRLEPQSPWYVAERQRLAGVLDDPAVVRAVRGEGRLPDDTAEQVAGWVKYAKTNANSPNRNRIKLAAEVIGTVAVAAHDALGDAGSRGPSMIKTGPHSYRAPENFEPRKRAANRVVAVADPAARKDDWIGPDEATIDADKGVRRRGRRA